MINGNRKIFNIVYFILSFLCLFVLTLFSYYLFKINIIPFKYLVTGYSGVLIIVLILFLIFISSKKLIKIISISLIFIFFTVFSYATYYLENTYHFLSNIQSKYDTLIYSVVVLKDSSYLKVNNLNDKNIGYLDDEYKIDINKVLNKKIKYNEKLVAECVILAEELLTKEIDAIVLEESYLSLIREEVNDFEEKTKIIYKIELKVKAHQEEEKKVEVSTEPFILYISGIDKFGNVNSVRGRSDVNQIVVVNPKTHHILLVNTPRDYYVQLAGTTGLKDKLTHAGIYGVDKSISTLEDLYNIDINYYLRVNFNTLIKVVDVIGGIDIESDSSFRCYTNSTVYVNKGWNHFNGKEALAYARERYAYTTGDRHRGENQQQVITSIINKVSKSEVLISKYNSILNTLDGSFQTDMDLSIITSFIRYQLDKMPTWNIESIGVTGYGSYNYTYSMGGGRALYVMEPDYNSISNAKYKINEVLNEK